MGPHYAIALAGLEFRDLLAMPINGVLRLERVPLHSVSNTGLTSDFYNLY